MYLNKFKKIVVGSGIFLLSSIASSDSTVVLCHTCQLSWVDTESSIGAIRIRSVDGSGSGICTGVPITTKIGLSRRKKDQIYEGALAALMFGKTITATGLSENCDSLVQITIKNN